MNNTTKSDHNKHWYNSEHAKTGKHSGNTKNDKEKGKIKMTKTTIKDHKNENRVCSKILLDPKSGYDQHTNPISLYTTIFQNPNQPNRNFFFRDNFFLQRGLFVLLACLNYAVA